MDAVIDKLIPIFILAFIGFTAGKLHLLPENTSDALCAFLFYFCGPAVSFSNIIASDIRDIFNFRFTVAMIALEAILFFILYFLFKSFSGKRGADLIIHVLCSFYGNISYVGIPVFLSLFNNVIPNLIVIMIHGVITMPVIIFLMDHASNNASHKKILRSALDSLKNPNIFVPVIAVLILFLKIPVPQVLRDSIDLLGKPTTPAGMFALGLTCSKTTVRSAKKVLPTAFLSAMSKLILSPVIAFLLARYIFHLDPWWMESLIIIAMLPAALNDYIISQRYHSSEDFASASVLMSTFLFSITISLYMLFIKV